jgi:hypothetical protein
MGDFSKYLFTFISTHLREMCLCDSISILCMKVYVCKFAWPLWTFYLCGQLARNASVQGTS